MRAYSQYGSNATGFVFNEPCPDQLYSCLMLTLDTYHQQDLFSQLKDNAMAQDFNWTKPVKEYLKAYHAMG
ncbi:MAG: hypothetical protein MI784_03380 [Cytophagales bacterium]|nr:hypothetical protein [Cytophagales bacterium]